MDVCCRCKGRLKPCLQCKDYWQHQCPECDLTNGGRDALENDETLKRFLDAHPLTQEEQREVNQAIVRLHERIRSKPEGW